MNEAEYLKITYLKTTFFGIRDVNTLDGAFNACGSVIEHFDTMNFCSRLSSAKIEFCNKFVFFTHVEFIVKSDLLLMQLVLMK